MKEVVEKIALCNAMFLEISGYKFIEGPNSNMTQPPGLFQFGLKIE